MNELYKDTWVFDLDNTLYHPDVRLFDQIEVKMERYMIRELGMSELEAKNMRSDFWHNHGTTLAGLMQVYGIDPDPFLHEVHDIDHSGLNRSPDLALAINNLRGNRMIYTNGSRKHGEAVSSALGIRECFASIYGIEDAGYQPKPHRDAFVRVFDAAQIDPTCAVMFEDDPRNLEIPHQMGMTTVLVGPKMDLPHIDHQTENLTEFLSNISQLQPVS